MYETDTLLVDDLFTMRSHVSDLSLLISSNEGRVDHCSPLASIVAAMCLADNDLSIGHVDTSYR